MNLRRTLATLVAALASGLGLCACEDAPSLSEMKAFRAYPVYYSGDSVAGHSLREVLGGQTEQNIRDTGWSLIYGKCEDPPDEGGCPYPLQIHNYSTCARWASLQHRKPRLFDFRGAKATRTPQGGGAILEIYTGRTTVTISSEERNILNAAARALRNVRQEHPSPLPPTSTRLAERQAVLPTPVRLSRLDVAPIGSSRRVGKERSGQTRLRKFWGRPSPAWHLHRAHVE